MGTIEIWKFFKEVSNAGEVESLSKEAFLRRLSEAMWTVYGVKKSHNVQRAGQAVRGFKDISVNEYA